MTDRVTQAETPGLLANIVHDVAPGLVVATLALAYCFSYAALIYVPPFDHLLGYGVGAALMTVVVAGTLVALKSSFPIAIAGAEVNAWALLSAMVAAATPGLMQIPDPAVRDATVLLLPGIATIVVGLVLFGLGVQRAGRLVRFVPYPVMAGILAATGWLIFGGGVRVATGIGLSMKTLSQFGDLRTILEIGGALAWTALLMAQARWLKNRLVMPLLLVGAVVATHVVLATLGIGLEEARAAGVLFERPAAAGLMVPVFHLDALMQVDPRLLLPAAGEIAGLAVVVALAILLNATGLELATRREADLDRELRLHGVVNLLSAVAGGYVGHLSTSRSLLNFQSGARGRASGVTVAVVMAGVLAVGPEVIGIMPRFVLAGLLMLLGLRLLGTWAVATAAKLPRGDYLAVLAILVLAANFGFIAGLVFGVMAGCVIFVLDVSRIGIVRAIVGAHEHPSSLARPPEAMAILAEHGHEVQVVLLRSFIFFGSAHRLYERVRTLARETRPRHLILDVAQVTGVDSSAGAAFLKMSQVLHDTGTVLCMSGDEARVEAIMRLADLDREAVLVFTTLDEALEHGENAVLARHEDTTLAHRRFEDWLSRSLGDGVCGERLMAYLDRRTVTDGEWLCRQGDETDTMQLVESGQLAILLELPGQAPLRVRAMGAHTIVGEMGFFLKAPRSASIRAETDSVLWEIDRSAYARLEAEAPELAKALTLYVIRIQAERLAFANRQIVALQRG